MSWADAYIQKLSEGEAVKFRPRGHSMTGIVNNGNLVTVVPASAETVEVGNVVLCRVSGSQYLHLVHAKDGKGRCQIANASGHVNGWTKAVYGRCIKVEP